MDEKRGIGKEGTLPWHLPGDLKHFKTLTTTTDDPKKQNALIMGRKTWDSIPEKFRPLPDRLNVVLSKNKTQSMAQDMISARSFEEAFAALETPEQKDLVDKIFVIGGAQIFKIALASPSCEALYLTHIQSTYACDTFFPDFESQYESVESSTEFDENGTRYFFSLYKRHRF